MEFLDSILDSLVPLISEPHGAATAVGIACAFWIQRILATGLGLAIAGGLAWTGHPWLCALVVVSLGIAWLIDCARYPRRDCLKCGGAGKFKRGFLWFTTSKECRGFFGCDGAGRKVRFGTKLLTVTIGDYFV